MGWEFPGELSVDRRGLARYPSSLLDHLEVADCQPLQDEAERPQHGSHLLLDDIPLDRREKHHLVPLGSLLCFHRRRVDPRMPRGGNLRGDHGAPDEQRESHDTRGVSFNLHSAPPFAAVVASPSRPCNSSNRKTTIAPVASVAANVTAFTLGRNLCSPAS